MDHTANASDVIADHLNKLLIPDSVDKDQNKEENAYQSEENKLTQIGGVQNALTSYISRTSNVSEAAVEAVTGSSERDATDTNGNHGEDTMQATKKVGNEDERTKSKYKSAASTSWANEEENEVVNRGRFLSL